jgi:hypothetical protein
MYTMHQSRHIWQVLSQKDPGELLIVSKLTLCGDLETPSLGFPISGKYSPVEYALGEAAPHS